MCAYRRHDGLTGPPEAHFGLEVAAGNPSKAQSRWNPLPPVAPVTEATALPSIVILQGVTHA
jgi:hypothetical protein